MAFIENKQSSGKSREYLTASSTTIAKGSIVTFASGYVTPVTASITAGTPLALANEAVTTASGDHQKILCTLIDPTMEFLADCDIATAQAQVGGAYKFKDAVSVDNATAGGSARIIEILPNKKAIVKFY